MLVKPMIYTYSQSYAEHHPRQCAPSYRDHMCGSSFLARSLAFEHYGHAVLVEGVASEISHDDPVQGLICAPHDPVKVNG